MAGQLAIDFGNAYTVAAFWRQDSCQAETLYIPELTRPMAAADGRRIYAAPSRLAYADSRCLIGQAAVDSGFADKAAGDLQFAVVTGKRVNYQAGSRLLSGQDMARDYLAAIIGRAGQVLGLGSGAVLTATVPLAACQTTAGWQRYSHWLARTARQSGFTRLELVEEPWAAAWGAGMLVSPGDVYMVVRLCSEQLEAAMVQAVAQAAEDARHVRVLSYYGDWFEREASPDGQCCQLTALLRQLLRQAGMLGYMAAQLAGVVVIGSAVCSPLLAVLRDFFPAVPVYDRQPLAAAACGAALLAAGAAGSGCLRYGYSVRYLTADGCQYREIMPAGLAYPSSGMVAEFTIRASYDGQQDFAVLLYRTNQQCVNEDQPLLFRTAVPAMKQQPVITVMAGLDSAGKLVVTATELASGAVIAENITVCQLV